MQMKHETFGSADVCSSDGGECAHHCAHEVTCCGDPEEEDPPAGKLMMLQAVEGVLNKQ